MSQKILHVFFDVDMRSQHHGLQMHAAKRKVHLENLMPKQHVVFINKAMDRVKMYSSSGVLSYLRVPQGLELEAINYIPEAFVGDGVDVAYAKALRKVLVKRLEG